MFKHKKVTRTLLAEFMALCFFIGPFALSVKADTNFNATSHGYTANLAWVNETVSNSQTGNPSGSSYTGTLFLTEITINWSIVADGYFDIRFSGYNSGNVFLCENCKLTSYGISDNGTGLARFYFNGQNYVKIYFYHSTASQTPTAFSGNWDISNVSEDAYLRQIYIFLSNNLTDSNNVSYIGRMDGNLTDIKSTLNTILTEVDNVEESLTSLITTSQYNIETYQHPAWIWASKYDSGFPRWKYGLPYMQYNTTTNDSTYTASHGIRLANGYSYAMIFYSSKAFSTSNVSVYYSATSASVQVSTLPITEINSQLYITALIFKNTNSGFTSFEPEFNQSFELYPLYFGLTNNIPDDVRGLLGQEYDNTYTRLLQQINDGISGLDNQYSGVLDDILDALQNLESDQTVIDNSTNITNNFDTDMTTINNIEVNLLTGIDNKFDDVNDSIRYSGVLDPRVDTTDLRWINFMSDLVMDDLTIVRYPIYIILIGFVLLCLLG